MSIKIRFVSRPIAPPWDSGSMNMAYGISCHLDQVHHSVYIPVTNKFQSTFKHLVTEPIYVNREFNLAQKLRLIKHLLIAPPVDLIHFFLGVNPFSAKLFSTIKHLKQTPSILTLTHLPPSDEKPAFFGDVVVTYSSYSTRLLQQSGAKNVVTIPPGVDVKAIHPGISGHKARIELGIPAEAKVVLYGGEYSRSATVSTLLESMALSIEADKNIYFILACRVRSEYEQQQKQNTIQYLQSVTWSTNVILQDTVPNMHALILCFSLTE